jgi:hypothetical protein
MNRFESWRRLAMLSLCATVALGSSACRADDTADETAAGGTVTEALTVTDVKLGTGVDADMRITDETDDFSPTDRIHVSVTTNGTAPSATLTARWLYQDGQVVDESTQTIAPRGQASTEFHISQANGLPAGDYRVVILLNGNEVETEEFTVK